MDLDRQPLPEMLRIINAEDATVAQAVGRELGSVAAAVELIVERRRRGGIIYFVGAGTSGRLGVIEAAEQTPTLETPDPVYRAIIAGGEECVFRSSEGAEDDPENGARDLRRHEVRAEDVVIGIAASGSTPYVHGALDEAGRRGAARILIVCNLTGVPETRGTQSGPTDGAKRSNPADVVIAPLVGPEVLTGATRLRAGTACKMVLNMMTVATMALTGKIYENLPVDVPKRSDKLIARATRIVRTLTGASEEDAAQALEAADYRAKIAVVMIENRVSREEAERILERAGGFLRAALES